MSLRAARTQGLGSRTPEPAFALFLGAARVKGRLPGRNVHAPELWRPCGGINAKGSFIGLVMHAICGHN
jgi:hypothetical protein